MKPQEIEQVESIAYEPAAAAPFESSVNGELHGEEKKEESTSNNSEYDGSSISSKDSLYDEDVSVKSEAKSSNIEPDVTEVGEEKVVTDDVIVDAPVPTR